MKNTNKKFLTISFRINNELHKRIKKLAKADKETKTKTIIKLIDAGFSIIQTTI